MSEDGLPEVLFRARLYRKDRDTPWGFRLQGGVEFNKPLTLLKVIPDSVASKVGLNAGDILVRLAGRSADSMTHRDAQQAIVNSGNSLEIIVERADVTFSSSSSSSAFVGSAFSDKGQLTINNDFNSETTYTDEKDDLKAAGEGEGGGGLRGRTSEEGVDSILESFSEKILNEIQTATTTTTKENDVSVRRISTSSSSSVEATPQIQLDQQHPSTSSASTTTIPDSPTTTTTMTNNAEVPPSPTTDRVQAPLSPSSLTPSSTSSGPGTHGGREPGQSNNDVEDTRQADGRLVDVVENDASGVGGVVAAIALEKDGERVDEKMTDDRLKMIDDRLNLTDERLKMTTDDRLRMTDDRLNMSTDDRQKMTDDRLKLPDDRLKMTIDDRLKMTTDDRLRMTDDRLKMPDDRLKMTIDDRLKMAPDVTTVATVLTDHNDNIPLDHLEEQNSFPVRALLKTSALTSELGDESSEGADDQSSEFSDDVSVIEVQGEGTTREEVASMDEEDEVDTLPDTDALFYQDETEYREISLLNFDDRFFEAASAGTGTAGAPRSSGAPSAVDPDPDGEMNRMKACFYLPSLVSPDNRDPATTAVTVQSLTVPVVTSEVWGAVDNKSPRDFSQTAPWRVSSSKTTSQQQPIPPRRTEDLSPTSQINTQQITWDEAKAHPIVSSYILNDPGHTGPENVIYIPISIFGKQLKLGSQYTFQRKDPTVAAAPSTSQQPAPLVGASSPVVASPPMSLTLMGRRSEDRHAQRVVEQPPPVADQPPPVVVVRSSDPGQSTHTVSVAISTASPAVTMATARVYIAPVMSSQSGAKMVPVPAATQSEAALPVVALASSPPSLEPPRRLSNEILSDLQDIPLPPVRDIVADLNSRLEKVAERYETSAASSASASAYQVPPSTELGTSFARPERRRSSSGSDSEKEIIIDTPPFSQDTTTVRLRERLLGDQVPPPLAPDSASTYRSVIYRGNPLSPKSIRRFSLPGGAMTVKDSVQRRVRFAEPPESSVIEIEGRQRRWPTGERIRSAVGDRIIRMRDDADAIAAEAEYVSVSSLAEKLDRIELENALASAAMKRSRPFQGPPQVSVSSLLAAHPADIRASSPGRGSSSGLVGRPTSWKLEPIQERVINLQTLQPPDVRRVDERQIRIGSQKPPTPAAAAVSGGSSSPSVRCTSDLGGGFSVSIGPGSGGQLSLSVQQHHPNHPGQGGNRHGHSPTRVNFVLPSSELGKPDQFSYSVSAGGVVSAREPLKYTLPPTYEESVRAMASGKHPRSSSLDDAKQMSMAAAAAAAAAYPPRISELRAESQMQSGAYPAQPGLRIMRAQSPTLSHASSHPGWVISSVPPGAQERDAARRGYSQTLQVDTGSRQLSRSAPQQPLQPPPPSSPSYALPVFHARSGALSSADLVGYHHHHHHQETSPQQQQQDRLMRMMVQQQQHQQPPPHHPGMRQAVSGEIPRQDIAARFYRSGSPLILSPPTGFSNSGSAKSAQGTVRSFSPVSSPSGPDRRWPPSHRFPDHLGQVPSPLTERRQWPTTSSPRPMTPTAQQPFVHEQPRQVLVQPSMAARPFPEASAAAAVAAGALAAQRLPGIFALLDKTFTDKVMQWEGGGGSRSSGGLQQSETYKLVREMDDAMKQDKQ